MPNKYENVYKGAWANGMFSYGKDARVNPVLRGNTPGLSTGIQKVTKDDGKIYHNPVVVISNLQLNKIKFENKNGQDQEMLIGNLPINLNELEKFIDQLLLMKENVENLDKKLDADRKYKEE